MPPKKPVGRISFLGWALQNKTRNNEKRSNNRLITMYGILQKLIILCEIADTGMRVFVSPSETALQFNLNRSVYFKYIHEYQSFLITRTSSYLGTRIKSFFLFFLLYPQRIKFMQLIFPDHHPEWLAGITRT